MDQKNGQFSTESSFQVGCPLMADCQDHSDTIHVCQEEIQYSDLEVESQHQFNLNPRENFFSDQWLMEGDYSLFQLENPAGDLTHLIEDIQNDGIELTTLVEETNQERSQPRVLKRKAIKKQGKKNPNKKNNIPKFLMRIFSKKLPEYKHMYEGHPETYCQVKKRAQVLEQWTHEQKNNFVGLEQLKLYFGKKPSETESYLNRSVMSQILEDHMKTEILDSSQIKNPAMYLQAAKVYRLRCCNALLAQRNQCD